MSNPSESIDSSGKEPDKELCPTMSSLSEDNQPQAPDGQIGQDWTNVLVQGKPLDDKEMQGIGQSDAEPIYVNAEVEE
jgi:hypothetical protein